MLAISCDLEKASSSLNWNHPIVLYTVLKILDQVFAYECTIVSATSLSHSSIGNNGESTVALQMPMTLTFPDATHLSSLSTLTACPEQTQSLLS